MIKCDWCKADMPDVQLKDTQNQAVVICQDCADVLDNTTDNKLIARYRPAVKKVNEELNEADKKLLNTMLEAKRSYILMGYGQGKELLGEACDMVKQIDKIKRIVGWSR